MTKRIESVGEFTGLPEKERYARTHKFLVSLCNGCTRDNAAEACRVSVSVGKALVRAHGLDLRKRADLDEIIENTINDGDVIDLLVDEPFPMARLNDDGGDEEAPPVRRGRRSANDIDIAAEQEDMHSIADDQEDQDECPPKPGDMHFAHDPKRGWRRVDDGTPKIAEAMNALMSKMGYQMLDFSDKLKPMFDAFTAMQRAKSSGTFEIAMVNGVIVAANISNDIDPDEERLPAVVLAT